MNRRSVIPSCIAAILCLLFFLLSTPSLFAELINDGSFENNPTDWSVANNTPCPSIGNWSNVAGAPASFDGQQTLWVGGVCNNQPRNNGAQQIISLQENAALLSFWFNPIKSTPDPQNIDRAVVAIDDNEVWNLDVNGLTNPTGWNNALVNISQYADQSVTLSLEIQQNVDFSIANVFFDYLEILHPTVEINQIITSAGENSFEVEITITNSGDTVLNNVAVTNSSFTECDRSAGSLPDLAIGESTVITCALTRTAIEVENTATVQATATEIEYPVEANHTAVAANLGRLLTLVVDPDAVSIPEGDPVPFAILLTNNGSSTLTGVQIVSAQATNCHVVLDMLAAGDTAVHNCTYTPNQSGTITFSGSAIEPVSGSEAFVETAVSIELLPTDPPAFPTFTQFIPIITNNYINHSPLGEPNDACDLAFPITINQAREFLAEDVHDWYRFTLDTPGSLTVNLTNFVPVAGQITIWRGTCNNLLLLGQNGDFATTKRIDLVNQPAGTYYVWLINDGPTDTNDAYELTVLGP